MVKISLPPEKRMKFFVYIIESPNPVDIYHGRFEGDMIKKALSLDKIPCAHRIVVNEEAFKASIIVGLLKEQMEAYKGLVPVIHISAHGGSEGIELTDGKIISWEDLKNSLLPISKALKGNLLLSMSSCKGISACRMAMTEKEEECNPFFAVIGADGEPKWSDTAIAYAAFYHLVSKGCYIENAVKGMCEASGVDDFQIITATVAKKAYLDVIKDNTAKDFQQALQSSNERVVPPSGATDLEKAKNHY